MIAVFGLKLKKGVRNHLGITRECLRVFLCPLIVVLPLSNDLLFFFTRPLCAPPSLTRPIQRVLINRIIRRVKSMCRVQAYRCWAGRGGGDADRLTNKREDGGCSILLVFSLTSRCLFPSYADQRSNFPCVWFAVGDIVMLGGGGYCKTPQK